MQRGKAPQQTPATPTTASTSTLAENLKLLPYALHAELLLHLHLPVPDEKLPRFYYQHLQPHTVYKFLLNLFLSLTFCILLRSRGLDRRNRPKQYSTCCPPSKSPNLLSTPTLWNYITYWHVIPEQKTKAILAFSACAFVPKAGTPTFQSHHSRSNGDSLTLSPPCMCPLSVPHCLGC